MGSGPSLELKADQPSTAEPGKLCVLTGSFDEFNIDYDSLIREIKNSQKCPYHGPGFPFLEPCVKDIEIEEDSPDDFTVKMILDGSKLDKVDIGNGAGTDKVATWQRTVLNKAEKRIDVIGYDQNFFIGVEAGEKTMRYKSVIIFLSNPLRFEFHMEDAAGNRISGQEAAGIIGIVIHPIVEFLRERKFRVIGDQPSFVSPGLNSVISEPLDAAFTYDEFWSKFIAILKKPSAPHERVENIHDKRFVVTFNKDLSWTITHNKDKGEILFETKSRVANTKSCLMVRKVPLYIESWRDGLKGTRDTGPHYARICQGILDQVCTK